MRQKRTEYNLKIIPESLKQGIATPVIQDLVLLSQPWPFNISEIPDQLASTIHIWHGTGDKQVPRSCRCTLLGTVHTGSLQSNQCWRSR